MAQKNVLWFNEVTKKDIDQVGGKNGSLGEMFSQLTEKGVNVPNGFATTADAYWYYLQHNGIDEKRTKTRPSSPSSFSIRSISWV